MALGLALALRGLLGHVRAAGRAYIRAGFRKVAAPRRESVLVAVIAHRPSEGGHGWETEVITSTAQQHRLGEVG